MTTKRLYGMVKDALEQSCLCIRIFNHFVIFIVEVRTGLVGNSFYICKNINMADNINFVYY